MAIGVPIGFGRWHPTPTSAELGRREATPGHHDLGVPPGPQRGADRRPDRRQRAPQPRRPRPARRRGGRDGRRLDRRHRRGRRAGRARVSSRSTKSSRSSPADRARATRSGSRCTRATATSSAGSTPTSATSGRTSSPGCSSRCSPIPTIGFVKGYYRRPLLGEPTGGGRVTELMARPVISALFPHLARVRAAAGRRVRGPARAARDGAVRRGVGRRDRPARSISPREFGSDALAQVDLDVREHRNRPLEELVPQAMAILVTGLRRAGVPVDKRLAELVLLRRRPAARTVAVEIRERPPIITIPAYREKFGRGGLGRELSA